MRPYIAWITTNISTISHFGNFFPTQPDNTLGLVLLSRMVVLTKRLSLFMKLQLSKFLMLDIHASKNGLDNLWVLALHMLWTTSSLSWKRSFVTKKILLSLYSNL